MSIYLIITKIDRQTDGKMMVPLYYYFGRGRYGTEEFVGRYLTAISSVEVVTKVKAVDGFYYIKILPKNPV